VRFQQVQISQQIPVREFHEIFFYSARWRDLA